ncbi:diphthine synthase [Methanoculleus bourgensis]|jgi:diphthine synthase|uniref:Diphthine synthase n=1 Tax=Methanoculleus bourgensis TaxID=83986 RepID=A0A0X3BJ08_9EURY|nr:MULTISPECIES: diphthine synthase [Methanoculleus]MBT0733746.1 diphthine synthase [Methanoculleus bourgensis]MDD3372451.1 diphthine synthase [Methanoculleus bourgensis]NMA89319.1 diphthine synthase [Methanoculleus bourgensis]CVK32003.1 Diphthine synthase [Methanoculleus bourgensis]
MLTFVGLGLYDLGDISLKGLECVRNADAVYLEAYTSRLMGTDVVEMEAFFENEIRVLSREDVEQNPRDIIERAARGRVAFLTGGDPMVSTTHADLRMRAAAAGVATSIIHASSISSAVCGLSGLQNYRFGKSCSVPFPAKGWFPTAPVETIAANLDLNLHTLVFLDIQMDRYMRIPEAIAIIEEMAAKRGIEPPALYVGIARAGSESPVVAAGSGAKLKETQFGPPLHVLVVPADLHPMEREYLEIFAGL